MTGSFYRPEGFRALPARHATEGSGDTSPSIPREGGRDHGRRKACPRSRSYEPDSRRKSRKQRSRTPGSSGSRVVRSAGAIAHRAASSSWTARAVWPSQAAMSTTTTPPPGAGTPAQGHPCCAVSTGTAIEWTEVTWNPETGCDRISPGCDHCYALTLAKRLKAMGQAKYQRDGAPRTSGPGFGGTGTRTPCSSRYGGVGRARCS